MPYLGRMKAAGKTPEELSREITEGLRGKYLKEPRVTVAIKQYNSRSYIVQGSVRSPGVYQIEHGASLLKLIGLAGGLAENHGSTAFIIRELKPQPEKAPAEENPAGEGQRAIPQYEMIKANINGLYLGHFDQNIPIEPGDIINIPPTDVFFVAGEVVAPGSYPLKPGTTVRQAISLARGFTFSAAKGRGIIFREDLKTGRREDIKVDFGQVMNGKRDDIAIHPNDIVIVPNSSWKSFGGALLRGFGTSFVTRGIPY
jgi:polysaccharide export outer membrane protein